MDYKKIAVISLTFVLAYVLKQKFNSSELNELDEQGLNLVQRNWVHKLTIHFKTASRQSIKTESINKYLFISSALSSNNFTKIKDGIRLNSPYGPSKNHFIFTFGEIL